MKCFLCHKGNCTLNTAWLCEQCRQGLEPLAYSRHLMTSNRHAFKMSILYSYTRSCKELIQRFKFSKEIRLSKSISLLLLESMDLKSAPDIITAVPSHPFDEVKRGYSHMDIIARIISKSSDIHHCHAINRKFFPIIKRNQRTKDREQRLKKKDRFKLNVSASVLKEKKILLIDDVSTTGATLQECAKLLLDNGAQKVEALCLALTQL